MSKKIFLIDNNNSKMKWLSTAWSRMLLIPIIDVIVLIGGIPVILLFLSEYEIANIYLGADVFVNYIWAVLIYVGINIFIAILDFSKLSAVINTMIIKEDNNITIVKELNNADVAPTLALSSLLFNNSESLLLSIASIGLYAIGVTDIQKKLTEKEQKAIEKINEIVNEKSENYKYTDYKNCRVIKETRNYYQYIGEKDGVLSKFKIYKVYANIEFLNKEEN